MKLIQIVLMTLIVLLGLHSGISNAVIPSSFESFMSALIRYESTHPHDKQKSTWKQLAGQFPEFTKGIAPGDLDGAIKRAFEPNPGDVRTALIIDNGAYDHAPLSHPAEDADLLAQGLKRLGFMVHQATNVDKQRLETAVAEFGKASVDAELALFYFTGRAVQSASKTYLVPIGSQVTREEEIPAACVPLERIWSALKQAHIRNQVVILDGAYAFPFSSGFKPQTPGVAMSVPPPGGMLGMSSAPNSLIPEGAPGSAVEGQPSVFMFNLIPKLFFPDVSLPEAFSMAKEATHNGTGGGIDPNFKASLSEPVALRSCSREFRLLAADLKKMDLLSALKPQASISKAAWEAIQKKHSRRISPSPAYDIQTVLAQALETPCFESRNALVVANSSYKDGPLVSADKEAAAVSETLKKLGFRVTLASNASLDTLKKSIDSFISALRWDGVGLLYYTGRAFQVGGQNFLLSVDGSSDAGSGSAVEKSIALSPLMDRMNSAQNQLNLVILNTAYSDPSGRSPNGDKPGLAAMSVKPHTFFLSSAPPDVMYPSAFSEKQIFVHQLIPLMEQENLPMSRLGTTLQVNLMAASSNQMTPWALDQLAGTYRLENGAASVFSFSSKERNFGKWLQPLSKYQTMEKMFPGDRLTRNAWSTILTRFPQFSDSGNATPDTFLDAVLRNDPGMAGHGIAAHLGLNPTRKNDLGMTFVYVPPGAFSMGSPPDEPARGKDESLFKATLSKGYYIQTTEVTQGQWKAVMGTHPATFRECGLSCPVEEVSWEDAQKFIAALNQRPGGNVYRLPSETEWEMACRSRGPGSTWFHFGDNESQLGEYAWVKENSGATPHPVAGKKPNERGLFDMHGNVWELCQDGDWTYPTTPTVDPAGKTKATYRVVRGGSWYYPKMEARCANRFYVLPDAGNYNVGLRLVMNP